MNTDKVIINPGPGIWDGPREYWASSPPNITDRADILPCEKTSPLQEEKDMRYIYSTLNELRLMVSPRHEELARLLDNTIEHSAGLVASAQDYVDQNR